MYSTTSIPTQAPANSLIDNLKEELHVLEAETFEIEDIADPEQNPATVHLCSSTCSCCVPNPN